MLDQASIRKRLDKLDEYVRILHELQKVDRLQFVSDYHAYGLAERYLHLAIECLLDISQMLVSGLGLRKPERYQQSIDILAKADVLSGAMAQRLEGIAGFRNILVHGYLDVDRDLVYQYMQEKLDDLQLFAQEVIRFMRSDRANGEAHN